MKRLDEKDLVWAKGILMEKLDITDDIVAFFMLFELAKKGLERED